MMKNIQLLSLLFFCQFYVLGQEMQWAYSASTGSNPGGKCITKDVFGNVVVAGFFNPGYNGADLNPTEDTLLLYNSNTLPSQDVFISKFNDTGDFLWAVRFGGGNDDEPHGMVTDDLGNIYIAGSFLGTLSFFDQDSVQIDYFGSNYNGSQGFAAKFNKDGVFQWAVTMQKDGEEAFAYGIDVDEFYNVYVVGQIKGTINFNSYTDTLELVSSGLNDIFVASYDVDGGLKWAFNAGSSSGYYQEAARDIDYNDGFIYVSGSYTGNDAEFNPLGTSSYNLICQTQANPFLAKYDVLGICHWAIGIDCGFGTNIAYGVDVDPEGDIYITGRFNKFGDFDPGEDTVRLDCFGGAGYDIFVAKYSDTGNYKNAYHVGGDDYDDYGYDIHINDSGYVYITGTYRKLGDFDPDTTSESNTQGNGSYAEVFVAKYNSDMDYQWAFNIGKSNYSAFTNESGYSVYGALDGKVFVTGITLSPADFDPSENEFLLANGYSNVGFIAAYNGNVIVIDTSTTAPMGTTFNKTTLRESVLNVYPNPTTGFIVVEMNEEGVINLYDTYGKLIYSRWLKIGEYQLFIEPETKGVYFLKYISKRGNTETKKIMVK